MQSIIKNQSTGIHWPEIDTCWIANDEPGVVYAVELWAKQGKTPVVLLRQTDPYVGFMKVLRYIRLDAFFDHYSYVGWV